MPTIVSINSMAKCDFERERTLDVVRHPPSRIGRRRSPTISLSLSLSLVTMTHHYDSSRSGRGRCPTISVLLELNQNQNQTKPKPKPKQKEKEKNTFHTFAFRSRANNAEVGPLARPKRYVGDTHGHSSRQNQIEILRVHVELEEHYLGLGWGEDAEEANWMCVHTIPDRQIMMTYS